MLHEISFQIINISSNNFENRDSELMRQQLPKGRCESYADSAEPCRSVRIYTIQVILLLQRHYKNRLLYPMHVYFPFKADITTRNSERKDAKQDNTFTGKKDIWLDSIYNILTIKQLLIISCCSLFPQLHDIICISCSSKTNSQQ